MSFEDLATAAASLQSDWVKLSRISDPAVQGTVIGFEIRERTFEGSPVLSRTTGRPRTEWVFTLDCGGAGPVKLSLNESGQRAVAEALKAAGCRAESGAMLQIRVSQDPETTREQATYAAKWTPSAPVFDVPVTATAPDPWTVTPDDF